MSTQQPEALRLALMLRGMGANRFIAKNLDKAAAELERLHARVQELEAQQERKAPTKEELSDYLMQQDAVIVARKTYEAMRGFAPLRRVDT